MGYLEDQNRASQLHNSGQTPGIGDSWGTRIEWQRMENERVWREVMKPKPRPETRDTAPASPPTLPVVIIPMSPEQQARFDQLKAEEFSRNLKTGLIIVGSVITIGLAVKAYQWADQKIIKPVASFFSGEQPAPKAKPPTAKPAAVPTAPPTAIKTPVMSAPPAPAPKPAQPESRLPAASPDLIARTAHDRQFQLFFDVNQGRVRLSADQLTTVSEGLIKGMMDQSLDKSRNFVLADQYARATYGVISSPLTADGTMRSVMCATRGPRVVAFSSAVSHYADGSVHTSVDKDIIVEGSRRSTNVSVLAKRMSNCEEALSELGARYGLLELKN